MLRHESGPVHQRALTTVIGDLAHLHMHDISRQKTQQRVNNLGVRTPRRYLASAGTLVNYYYYYVQQCVCVMESWIHLGWFAVLVSTDSSTMSVPSTALPSPALPSPAVVRNRFVRDD